MTIAAVRLNHAVLFVSDLERSLRFWADAFGMEVVAHEPRANAVFLRLPRSGNHHDLGLFGLGAGAPPKRPGTVGLYHLAWQVDTIDELADARETLVRLSAYTGESSHGATKSIYGVDPDGNEFEVSGCCRALTGAPTPTPPRSSGSTSTRSCAAGAGWAPPAGWLRDLWATGLNNPTPWTRQNNPGVLGRRRSARSRSPETRPAPARARPS